ncbi:MAG TPA: FAD-binding protein [Bryobacteraceae bacterium]|nr:FAD-binding protein [Bryobacteraceae bacterium]
MLRPESPEQLVGLLRDAASAHRTIRLGGNFSKDALGGPLTDADVTISTASMSRLRQYDPRDLTISVEAGMPFAELARTLAGHKQMLPLDPPWFEQSTVGGVLAANLSGPRRRLYGTARDMVIGLTFATLEGKLINSGGMVVKNVAGLDMAKLLIGSYGTLAAIAIANFKVFPMPAEARTFVMEFETAAQAFAERDRILNGVLQPAAIDIVNLPRGFRLLVQAGGSGTVLDRYARELPHAAVAEESVWDAVREFSRRYLTANPGAKVVAMHMPLSRMAEEAAKLSVPFIARAGCGVIYAHYSKDAPETPLAGDFATMTKVKEMFDPERLLNRGRLYGRI